MRNQKAISSFLRCLVYAAFGFTAFTLIMIIGWVLVKGVPNLKPELFALEYNSENASLFPAMVNTVIMTALSLAVAAPLGIFSAVYLVEYAKKGNKFVKVIRTTTETLSGIPSIVYGLFGYLLFVIYFGWGYSITAGALTLSVMVLPVIIRTTEEALKSVDDSFREGSFGLGAGKLRTIFKIVLPSASKGILSGIILSIGRIVGETAALIYTAGTVAQIPDGFLSSGRTLSVHMYVLWKEGFNSEKSYATAVVLLVVVTLINALSDFVVERINREKKNG